MLCYDCNFDCKYAAFTNAYIEIKLVSWKRFGDF